MSVKVDKPYPIVLGNDWVIKDYVDGCCSQINVSILY